MVIAGDIVDRKNRYYEAFGDFESGVKKLSNEGIPLYLVSGNHDFDAVPDLVASLTDYEIGQLGNDGKWGSVRLSKDGAPIMELVGWSYPGRHVENNPIELLEESFTDELPVVGVLHSDLNRPDSQYAPVSSADLERTGFSGWIIGHIHKPELQSDIKPFRLTPGSPQPLDPTESGPHGPWVLTIDNKGIVEAEQYSLANLRYERLSINVEGIDRPEEIPAKFYSGTDNLIEEAKQSPLQLLLVSLELAGRSPIYDDLEGKFDKLVEDLRRESGEIDIGVTSVINNIHPPVDLEEISRGNNPPAVLADLILKLEKGETGEVPKELLTKTGESLSEVYYSNAYRVLRSAGEASPPGKNISLEQLKRQAWLIMDSLLSQTNHGQEA